MPGKLEIVQATRELADRMAPNMREADKAEVWALAHHSPREALRASVHASTVAWAALSDGEPIAMWGVGGDGLLSNVGSPWLLATPRAAEFPIQFLRQAPKYIKLMLERHPKLINLVDARQTDTLKWLRWAGFIVFASDPAGVEQLPFHRILMRR